MKKLLLITFFILTSCNGERKYERINKYSSGVIFEKLDLQRYNYYTVEYKGEIIYVKVYDIDFQYNVGDKIK